MIYFAIFLSFNQGQKAWQLSQKHEAGRGCASYRKGKEFGDGTERQGHRESKPEEGRGAKQRGAGLLAALTRAACTCPAQLVAACLQPQCLPLSRPQGGLGCAPASTCRMVSVWC